MILVDYRCPTCGPVELFVSSPPPSAYACPTCGEQAARRFSTAGLSGGTPGSPGDLGMCFGSASAQRRLHAIATGDERAYAAETARQTERFERHGPPTTADVLAHPH